MRIRDATVATAEPGTPIAARPGCQHHPVRTGVDDVRRDEGDITDGQIHRCRYRRTRRTTAAAEGSSQDREVRRTRPEPPRAQTGSEARIANRTASSAA